MTQTKHPIFGISNHAVRYTINNDLPILVNDSIQPLTLSVVSLITTGEPITIEEAEKNLFTRIVDAAYPVYPKCAGVGTINPDLYWLTNLLLLILRQANLIGTKTKRSVGNIVIVSEFIYEKIILAYKDSVGLEKIHSIELCEISVTQNLRKFGLLKKRISLFVNSSWNDKHPIIVAYKGNNENDAGAYLISTNNNNLYYETKYDTDKNILGTDIDYFSIIYYE